MIDLDDLYFGWLLTQLDPDGVSEGVAYLGDLLHNCEFQRRIGNDVNRAIDGSNLRKSFMTQFDDVDIDPRLVNTLLMMECTWFEMMIALATHLDYLYEGGVENRFIEMAENLELGPIMRFETYRSEEMREYDQRHVDIATNNVDQNKFDRDGKRGLFPLRTQKHPDQRGVEIWDQCAAYFRERLEGVLWTSTS